MPPNCRQTFNDIHNCNWFQLASPVKCTAPINLYCETQTSLYIALREHHFPNTTVLYAERISVLIASVVLRQLQLGHVEARWTIGEIRIHSYEKVKFWGTT